jgi:DNA repair protein RadC
LSLRALSDAALLGRALGFTNVRAERQGQRLLLQVGSLAGALGGGGRALHLAEELQQRHATRLELLVELHRRATAPDRMPTRVRSVQDVLDWARPGLVELDHEELWLLCLNAKNALRCAERVAQGGLHGCSVTPRDVLRPAVRNAAAAVVVVHNHPSGDPTPSPEDYAMTRALAHACDVVGIPLLDHVVVARAGACSVGVAPLGA